MQSVSDRWYTTYAYIATILAILLIAGCVLELVNPTLLNVLPGKLTLIYTTLAISSIQVIYALFFYKREVLKNSRWSATLFLSLIQALNIINLIHNTGRFHSWFLIFWGFALLMSGMFGNYAVVGYCFLVTIYFILLTPDTLDARHLDIFSIVGVGATYIGGVVSYLLWRNFYVDQESSQVARLSGALKSKQQQTEVLIQSITDGMIVINTEGKINILNPAAAAMTGWSVDEAAGIDVQLVAKLAREDGSDIKPADNPFVKVLTDKKPINDTLQLIKRNGNPLIVSLVISPVLMPKSGEAVGAVAVMRDISSMRAEERQRADFISTASHEMRTPVAAIEGYLALALNDKVTKIDSKARDYLEKAHSSTQHLGQLFQDLLTSAKAEDGRLASHPQVVEMGAFVEQLVETFRFSAEKKGLQTEFVIGASSSESKAGGNKIVKPLYYVHVDPDRIREVITNLFDNAVKYTSSGKVSIGLTGNPEVVQLYVRDTGPGIASEDIPHLFQKFYRVDSSITRTVGGTGLGLFISRKIIELYKGRIWVESQIGKGSTFYINLPRLSTPRAAELQSKETNSFALPAVTTNDRL